MARFQPSGSGCCWAKQRWQKLLYQCTDQSKASSLCGEYTREDTLINFFDIDGAWMLVDVPGYGYARMSKEMLKKMGKMMEDYFSQREQLKLAIQLVDARHDPTNDDLDMIEYFKSLQIPILWWLLKSIRFLRQKRIKALKNISQKLQLPLKNIYGISSTEKIGFDEVYQAIIPSNSIDSLEFPENLFLLHDPFQV